MQYSRLPVAGIYRIVLGNGYSYIGSACNLYAREKQHLSRLKRGKHENVKMQNNWNKYKEFGFDVVELCEPSDLLVKEQMLIDVHFSSRKNVNIAPVAGSRRGIKLSILHRAKISASLKGRIVSEETLVKMRLAQGSRQRLNRVNSALDVAI